MRIQVAACVAAVLPLSATAGPLKPQPDFVAFGRVNVGAVAEASVILFADGSDATGLSVSVKPPAFVRIDRVRIYQQNYGPDSKVSCSFEMLLDTRKEGELKGEISVEFAGGKQSIPVTATVARAAMGQSRVLIVETPFHMQATDDAKMFEPWLNLVRTADLDVQYWLARKDGPVLRGNPLDNVDVLLLAEQGLFHLQNEDRIRLKRFVELGGRLVLCGNHFFRGSVDKANEIVAPYGIKMHDEEQPFGRDRILLPKERIVDDQLTKEVQQLFFHRPSPISVTSSKKAKAKLLTRFDDDVGVVAVARTDPGEIVVLGESMWWLWISRDGKSDNAKLLRNLLTKPPAK